MIFKSIFVYPKYSENLNKLYQLAYNLWCIWNYDAINLFYSIDSQLFRSVNHNPVKFLISLPKKRIDELSQDKGFLFELEKVWGKFQEYLAYKDNPDNAAAQGLNADDVVVYFAMEFGLHECIPIYGGGLGILSGDFLKSASDSSLPVIGVGLIYKFGYFTQRINLNGRQEELFLEFDNHLIPMRELRRTNGEKAFVEINILNQPVKIKLWQIDIGQTKLILLDTDIEDNPPNLRDITRELYVSDRDKRLQQEIVLGLGGIKALESLNIKPKIYHINEGHSAFLIIARLQRLITQEKMTFSQAKALIRASTVFTTHTPVIAGNENFESKLIKEYLEQETKSLGIPFDQLIAHGFIEDNNDVFWLPAFAMRFAKYINCVSKLHRDVSRKMWAGLFPQTPAMEIPIEYVTNGVHWSWLSEHLSGLLNRHIGPKYVHCGNNENQWDKIMDIPDEDIWQIHHENKQNLVTFIRNKLRADLENRGYIQPRILKLTRQFSPDYLTVVFARRFAHYKRATLILNDMERLKKILTNPAKPVQLIFAGKAHPADTAGKEMIKEIIDFAKDYQLEDRVIFLENYDINIARHLAWGADVWLNTPIRENEASGTSGIKAAINGVLNLSVLDGWWPEAYNGKNGWAITAGQFYSQSDLMEIAEASQIYDLLEEEITTLYYDRNEVGIPEQWVKMMKESICSVCKKFNMNGVLKSYLDKLYMPSKRHFESLCRDSFLPLKQLDEKEQKILKYWDGIKFTSFSTSADKKDFLIEEDNLQVSCSVDLSQAPPELFTVELCYILDNDNNYKIIPMQPQDPKGSIANYECSFKIEGYGLQNINARIKPADGNIQDLHPELVKWKW